MFFIYDLKIELLLRISRKKIKGKKEESYFQPFCSGRLIAQPRFWRVRSGLIHFQRLCWNVERKNPCWIGTGKRLNFFYCHPEWPPQPI